jgi:ferrous iron transport protein B
MSRAAFLMDRIMSKVGLHGKSFIPLLSGYACAVPGIMGTRVIENKRDRFATILILPLMSCSARLPVYLLFTALFFAEAWQGTLVMLSMYALGTLAAFGMAWIFKRTLLKGPTPAFILEMPPYRRPHFKTVAHTVGVRCWAYLKRAGTVIFAFSVIMWAATHYPKPNSYSEKVAMLEKDVETAEARFSPAEKEKRAWFKEHPNAKEGDPSIPKFREPSADEARIDARVEKELKDAEEALGFRKASEEIEYSVAGRAGKFVAPIFYPLGYDWKGSVGVMGAFFAREVVVSTMGIVYSVGEADEESDTLKEAMQNDVWPEGSARAGQKVWTPLSAISMMVFVVFCMQCLSTLAVAKREMGSWKWPAFMFVYMTGLAYVMALIVYQGGILLGFK